MTIGERIAAARETRNMTQEELAKALGTGVSTIGMWETDRRVPRDNWKRKIAEYFGLSILDLFF